MTDRFHRLGSLFYLVDRNSTTFQRPEDVPNYINEAIPAFLSLMVVEWLVMKAKQKPQIRLNDCITSISHGILQTALGVLVRGLLLFGYGWVYQWRLFDLDWSSPLTWWLAALGIDHGYYWFHRAAHEINFIWASHQVHHSSEDYNLSTALRQSMLQRYFSFVFHLPLALVGVPHAAALVHMQFNLLYQFWIHTELVGKCGPLEWILNTPSHHRVHHGANKWCLDKNYAGVLIIWDRLYGTFEAEREDEAIAYGLVSQPQSLNVPWLQFFYFGAVFQKARSMSTWGDALRALFYGPGWFPGTPRLGDPDTFPDVRAPRAKYDPQLPLWQEVYVVVHFLVVLILNNIFISQSATFSMTTVLMFFVFIFLSIGIIGAMYDGWWWAPLVEAARCAAYVAYARFTPVTNSAMLDDALIAYFALSTLMWVSQSLAVIRATVKAVKMD